MSVADRLNKLTTDITNAYTSIENKGGTIPANKNTNNLPTAINSIEVIEQATAEGESLSLTNTKAMPYSDYVVEGKSEQATRSGKNLFDASKIDNSSIVVSNNGKTITLPIVSSGNGATSGVSKLSELCPALQIGDNIYVRFTRNLGNTYNNFIYLVGSGKQIYNTSNTATTITQQDLDSIVYFYANRFQDGETQQVVLTDFRIVKNSTDEWEQFGASPSPDYPSEIHSVADDVNLFDVSNYTITYGGAIGFDVSNFEIGKQYTFSSNLPITDFKISNYSSGYNSVDNYVYNGFTNFTFTMARNSNIPSSETQYLFIALNLTNFITDINDITNYNIKVQKGSTPTSYSPYNQGTVTIKQETVKNYLDWNKFIDYSNWSNAESDGYKSFEISGLDTNKIYTLCRVDTAGYGEELKYAGFSKYKDNGNMFLHSTDNSQNLKNISSFTTQDGKIYINMFMNSQNDLNDYIAIIKKCWVIEGTDYEPYQSNDYTIQTEPLRSLPNGVKDTIELQDMQNHTRIGRQTGTLTETTTITLSDAKTDGAYMCNIKPSGTLTGKTIELEAGDYEIIYELKEETIEPLTQNQATTMLDIIKTGSYEGTTNIYTDEDVKPTIGVGYYKKG